MTVDIDPDVLTAGAYGASIAMERHGLNPTRCDLELIARCVLANAMSGGRLVPHADHQAKVDDWKAKARLATAQRAQAQVAHEAYILRVRDAIEAHLAAGHIDAGTAGTLAAACGVCITGGSPSGSCPQSSHEPTSPTPKEHHRGQDRRGDPQATPGRPPPR